MYWKLVLILVLVLSVAGVSFLSCGDDDDEDEDCEPCDEADDDDMVDDDDDDLPGDDDDAGIADWYDETATAFENCSSFYTVFFDCFGATLDTPTLEAYCYDFKDWETKYSTDDCMLGALSNYISCLGTWECNDFADFEAMNKMATACANAYDSDILACFAADDDDDDDTTDDDDDDDDTTIDWDGGLLENGSFDYGIIGEWDIDSLSSNPIIYHQDSMPVFGITPHTYEHLAIMGLVDNAQEDLSQRVTIPANATSGLVTCMSYIQTSESGSYAYDKLFVQLYVQSVGYVDLGTLSNVDQSLTWVAKSWTVPGIAAYQGEGAFLHFTVDNDSSGPTTFVLDSCGFYINP